MKEGNDYSPENVTNYWIWSTINDEKGYSSKPHLCPVCGQTIFPDVNSFEICEICGWEDDAVQEDDPDYDGGANRISLNEARTNLVMHLETDWISNHAYEYPELHGNEYEYERIAGELAQMGCTEENGILGYLRPGTNVIVRYNTKSNDFVVADVIRGIMTMFRPKDKRRYFERQLKKDRGIQ